MTVAEIKEYIDDLLNNFYSNKQYNDSPIKTQLKLIKSMLDELEPKAKVKWVEKDSLKDCKIVVCENCNSPTSIKKNIVGLYVLPRHCEKCGARMEVEDE